MISSPNKISYKLWRFPLTTINKNINKHIDGLIKQAIVFSWTPFIFLIITAFKASTPGKKIVPEITIKMKKASDISSYFCSCVYSPYPIAIKVTPMNEMQVNNKSVNFMRSFRRRKETKTVAIGVRLRLTAWKVSEMYFTKEYCIMFSIHAEIHRTAMFNLLFGGIS